MMTIGPSGIVSISRVLVGRHTGPHVLKTTPRSDHARLTRRGTKVSASFNLPIFGKSSKKALKKRETVIPEPSYTIPLTLLGGAGLSHISFSNDALSGVLAVLGAFLAFQASRVKFVFEDDALEVVVGDRQEETENKFVGGRNRWAYDSFVNWEFWWPGFPVLVYFKETQTKPEGQVHFFPLIFNGKQVYDVMVERCGPSQTSGPRSS